MTATLPSPRTLLRRTAAMAAAIAVSPLLASMAPPTADVAGRVPPVASLASLVTLHAQASASAAAPSSRFAAPARTPRKLLYSVMGAAIGGGLYLAYDRMSLGGQRGNGCAPTSCALPYLTMAGAIAGFFAGYERDQSYQLRYRYGAPIEFRTSSLTLRGDPLALAVRDSLVAIASSEGVHVVSTGPRLRSMAVRAAGFSGLTSVDFAADGRSLGVASTQSVVVLPAIEGRGVLARETGADVLIANGEGLLVAGGRRVEFIPDGAAEDSSGPWQGVDVQAGVRGGRRDVRRNLIWLATDSGVSSVRVEAGAPRIVHEEKTPYPARSAAAEPTGARLAVAMGNRGVALYTLDANGRPSGTPTVWDGGQYAYDVAWFEGALFVAAGTEGLYRLVLEGTAVTASELARDVGFPISLEVRGGEIFLLDRSRKALVRVQP